MAFLPVEVKATYIDTPDTCVKLQKVEEDKIYLTSVKDCPYNTGKLKVDLKKEYEEVYVFVDGKLWKKQKIQKFDTKTLQKRLSEIEKESKDLKIPENTYKAEGEKEAQKVVEIYNSEEFQEKN